MKKKVAFVCVHNSCRSQITEALAKKLGSDVLEVYSAGTEIKEEINPDARRLMMEMYGIDMEKTQKPKLIQAIPPVDEVITMGCNVVCPVLPFSYKSEDWGLEDPTGKGDEAFINVIRRIEEKVIELIERAEEEGE